MNAVGAPGWVADLLPVALWASVVAGAVWLVLSLLDYQHRKAYNLTIGTRGGKGATPDFLTVDHEKRAAARAAGDAFDAKIAARDLSEAEAERAPGPAPAGKAMSIAKLATAAFGTVTAISVILGAVGRIEFYDDAVRRLTSWERLVEILEAHWIGFVVAALIIVAHIAQAFRQARSG